MMRPQKVMGFDTGRLGLWNPANLLTFSRLILAIAAIFSFEMGWLAIDWAFGLIFLGAISDLDGIIARKFNCSSEFGAHLDPFVDKLFLAIVGLWSLFNVGPSLWLPLFVVIIAQFLIAIEVLINYKEKSARVDKLGKWTMMLAFSAVLIALFSYNFEQLEFIDNLAMPIIVLAAASSWWNLIRIVDWRK